MKIVEDEEEENVISLMVYFHALNQSGPFSIMYCQFIPFHGYDFLCLFSILQEKLKRIKDWNYFFIFTTKDKIVCKNYYITN